MGLVFNRNRNRRSIQEAKDWLESLSPDERGALKRFYEIGAVEGDTPVLDGIRALLGDFLEHGPELLALIASIVKMFRGV